MVDCTHYLHRAEADRYCWESWAEAPRRSAGLPQSSLGCYLVHNSPGWVAHMLVQRCLVADSTAAELQYTVQVRDRLGSCQLPSLYRDTGSCHDGDDVER